MFALTLSTKGNQEQRANVPLKGKKNMPYFSNMLKVLVNGGCKAH